MRLAASSLVPESGAQPFAAAFRHFVFYSTAAVYGNSATQSVIEEGLTAADVPMSPFVAHQS
jgi:UDP-glucose 4-epimerase